jgi:hypothetical protein
VWHDDFLSVEIAREMRRPRKNQPRPILVLPCRVSTLRLCDFSNFALC